MYCSLFIAISESSPCFKDRCGPCIKRGQQECKALCGTTGHLTVSCKFCSKCKKTCDDPQPLWVSKACLQGYARWYVLNLIPLIVLSSEQHHWQVDGVGSLFVYDAHYAHIHIGLDEDTHRQLNRIEAMLNAICERQGITPDTLPGYDCCRSPSPSSHSPSSLTGAPMERLQLSNVASEPLQQAGMYICAYPT